jgi:hypothetical protein
MVALNLALKHYYIMLRMRVSVSLLILVLHQLNDGCTAANFHVNSPRHSIDTPRRAHDRYVLLRILQNDSDAKSMRDNGRHQVFQPIHTMTIRGGDNGHADREEDKTDGTTSEMIGIIDLRPKPQTDCIILAKVQNTNPNSTDGDIANKAENETIDVQVLRRASFSSISSESKNYVDSDSELPTNDEDQQEAAAACLTIGSSCSTIYLILSYDFKEGKTVLHRTLGGTKLMCLVDGVRKRWHEAAASKPAATELVLLLVPTTPSKDDGPNTNDIKWCTQNEVMRDLSQNTDWKNDGIQFLANRLTTYFELGGDEFKGANPFRISVMYVADERLQAEQSSHRCIEDDHSDSNDIMDIVLHHTRRYTQRKHIVEMTESTTAREFRSLVKSKFNSFGGKREGPAFL